MEFEDLLKALGIESISRDIRDYSVELLQHYLSTFQKRDPEPNGQLIKGLAHRIPSASEDFKISNENPLWNFISTNKKITELPFWAMLSYTVGDESKFAKHEILKALVTGAICSFTVNTINEESTSNSPVSRASDAIRRLDQKKYQQFFAELPHQPKNLTELSDKLEELRHTENFERHASMLTPLLSYVIEETAPKKRSSSSGGKSERKTGFLEYHPVLTEDYPHTIETIHTTVPIKNVSDVEQKSDDLPLRSYHTIAPPIEREKAKLASIKRFHSQSLTHSLVMKSALPPCHLDMVSMEEIGRFQKSLFDRLYSGKISQYELSLIVLGLLCLYTGRNFETVCRIIEKATPGRKKTEHSDRLLFRTGLKPPALEINLSLPEHKQVQPYCDLLDHEQRNCYWLPLPEFLRDPLNHLRQENVAFPTLEAFKDFIAEMAKETGTKITPARLANVLYRVVFQICGQQVISSVICGNLATQYAPQYYCTLGSNKLIDIYQRAVSKLLSATETRSPHANIDRSKGKRVGSRIEISPVKIFQEVRNFQVKCQKKVDNYKLSPIERHNDIAAYTYLLLNIATAIRPVSAPFDFWGDINLNACSAWISDKEIKLELAARIIYFPEVVAQQLVTYRIHLEKLEVYCNQTQHRDYSLVERALTGEGPFLIWSKNNRIHALQPKFLVNGYAGSMFANLPLNWPRHFWATLLRNELPEDIVDAHLGHGNFELEPTNRWSGLSHADLRQASDVIGNLLAKNGVNNLTIKRADYAAPIQEKKANQQQLASVGSGKRSAQKQVRLKQLDKRIQEEWDQLPLYRTSSTVDEKNEAVRKAMEALVADHNEMSLRFRIKKTFYRNIVKLNQKRDEADQLYIPDLPVTLSRSAPWRTRKWHRSSQSVINFVTYLLDFLENHNSEDFSPEMWLAACITSAATFGGLNDKKALSALTKELTTDGVSLSSIRQRNWGSDFLSDQYFMDLVFSDQSIQTGILDGKPVLTHRWFLDPVSLLFLRRFNDAKGEKALKPKSNGAIANAFSELQSKIGYPPHLRIPYEEICQFGNAYFEYLNPTDISMALSEVMTGHQISVSLPFSQFELLFKEPKEAEFSWDLSSVSSVSQNSSQRSRQTLGRTEYRELHTLLRSKTATGDKVSREQASKDLKSLVADDWCESVKILRDWAIDLLDNDNLQVSTVKAYLSTIGPAIRDLFYDLDLQEMEGEDFYDCYQQVLKLAKSKKLKSDLAWYLQRFHDFCVRMYDFPRFEESLGSAKKHPLVVRAGYLPNHHYFACMKALMQQFTLPSYKVQALQILFILAYRTGLRIGEILKIRLEDVFVGETCWIFVTNNRYGSNKTRSSNRKIPISVLLTSEEMGLFRDFYSLKSAATTMKQALLFSDTQQSTVPWNALETSRQFTSLMRHITGNNDMVFHHLRHTALSNLQFVIEREWSISSHFMGVSEGQVADIFEAICGRKDEKLRVYWH
ncbi:tyrosine-type recombinase/integrase [Sneathiella limimaris]|uniref:tyrosine-type recombinase/integrase n=1 Tax=Sneathiella limimaris TaxID=1964213 RepID=UPI00146C621F|nr:tyrosine-type recombinase/integrase [Sneathiella limimaris]